MEEAGGSNPPEPTFGRVFHGYWRSHFIEVEAGGEACSEARSAERTASLVSRSAERSEVTV